jgi:hypothetical protein
MYRILTEDKNREAILSILDAHVDSYSVMPIIGSWKGTREASLAIDLVATSKATVISIATDIKAANRQESVLILDFTAQPIYV